MAEKRPYSKKELEETATHIVVGKVQAIYSRTVREGNYEYVHKVAEVKIEKLEKGKGRALFHLVAVRMSHNRRPAVATGSTWHAMLTTGGPSKDPTTVVIMLFT